MAYLPSSPDLRDYYLPGGGPSRLTPRRLLVLIQWLPAEAPLWSAVHAAEQKALKPKVEKIRERQEHYARQKALVAEQEGESA